MTMTSHTPDGADKGILSAKVMLVEPNICTSVAVILASPAFASQMEGFVPKPKFEPSMITGLITVPFWPWFGEIEVTEGAGASIVNAAVFDPDCPSVFVTTTSHCPSKVEVHVGMGSVQVILLDETTVTLVAVIGAGPSFCSWTDGVVPTTKFVPARFVT
jgi:hypothetical protein